MLVSMGGSFPLKVKDINVRLEGDALVDYEDGHRPSEAIREAMRDELADLGDGDPKAGLLKFLLIPGVEFEIDWAEVYPEDYENEGFDN